MMFSRWALTAALIAGAAACSDRGPAGLPASPSPVPAPAPAPAPPTPLSETTRIDFAGLVTDGVPLATYAKDGFSVTLLGASWTARTTFGNPAPFVWFLSPPATSTTAEVMVTHNGFPFVLTSVDVYSSTTQIPYVISGSARGTDVFVTRNTLGNTFGAFTRLENPHGSERIDMLSIRLTNTAATCCLNSMGLDNMVLRR